MLIYAKMRRSGFSFFDDFRFLFCSMFFSFSLSIYLLDRFDFLLQIASSFSSLIIPYLSSFQNFLIRSKKFVAKQYDPDSFKCKPFKLKCFFDDISVINCVNVADGRLIDLPQALSFHYLNAVLVSK